MCVWWDDVGNICEGAEAHQNVFVVDTFWFTGYSLSKNPIPLKIETPPNSGSKENDYHLTFKGPSIGAVGSCHTAAHALSHQ